MPLEKFQNYQDLMRFRLEPLSNFIGVLPISRSTTTQIQCFSSLQMNKLSIKSPMKKRWKEKPIAIQTLDGSGRLRQSSQRPFNQLPFPSHFHHQSSPSLPPRPSVLIP